MTAEVAHSGGQPESRVAARSADLEYLTVPLGRHNREEELPGRARHGARALRCRDPALPLLGVLPLESLKHGANAVVEHGRTLERGVDLALNLRAYETGREVVVHDTTGLHGCIDGRRADEAEAGPF